MKDILYAHFVSSNGVAIEIIKLTKKKPEEIGGTYKENGSFISLMQQGMEKDI